MDLPVILLILTGISIGATVIAIVVALRSAREARTAIFPIVKEEESKRARQARVSILVWVAITAILLGAWLASLSFTATEDEAADTESGQSTPTGIVVYATEATTEILPADIAAPADEAIEQPTEPTAAPIVDTPTPIPAGPPDPTNSPTPVPPTVAPTRAPQGPAPDDAEIGPIQFATEISSGPIAAVNPTDTFPTGVKIYAVYPYRGMQNGTAFSGIWYQNNVEIARDERGWEWGWQGNSYSFLLPPGEGSYKLDIYVNDSLLATGAFEVR